eukprot:NODE_12183_length_1240_cov_10.017969.p4 GENE.NODE_12183_length_1240_cov_10.017969~~NODE_12183_length_1240_cov_10.017969.p4  ORF type:complete len:89 (+),score=29.70 NODE_12183_length_1240_cov_10.017969:893-1159(+)
MPLRVFVRGVREARAPWGAVPPWDGKGRHAIAHARRQTVYTAMAAARVEGVDANSNLDWLPVFVKKKKKKKKKNVSYTNLTLQTNREV